ncbi:hypothetical protein [Streptomyces sp. NPDC005548]|uniref:hypothetical protein n=1 Tax=Streptomyces sp. NPDC005548 TaxID=3364724 RepID=UPI0036A9F1CD
MKNVAIRRWAVGAAGMVLGLGVVGCGVEKGGSSAADHAPGAEIAARTASAATPTPKSPTQRPLTQDQLEQTVVDERDLPGLNVTKLGSGTDGFGDGTVSALHEEATRPVSCAPVSAAVSGGASRHAPIGSVTRMAQSKDGTSTFHLVSYRAADAVRVMDELRSALATCTTYTVKWPTDTTFEDLQPTGDPHRGDEGVSFRLDLVSSSPGDDDPVRLLQSFQVIRSGSTVAVFSAFDTEAHRIEEVPAALVKAQMKVLGTGGHRS